MDKSMWQDLQEVIWHNYWNRAHVFAAERVSWLVVFFDNIFHRYELWRVSSSATKLMGPRWRRSVSRLEIDLTYSCNLRCNDCNRSAPQAPSSASVSKEQIRACLEASVARGYHWTLIRLLGGEPTLHPEFLGIIELLRAYRGKHQKTLRIEVVTNGYGRKVNEVLQRIPPDIIVRNTKKAGSQQGGFEPFNRAPCDLDEHRNSNFASGCWITQYCGMGLTPTGYYHCAVAGGIDRVFGLGIGRSSIPDVRDPMHTEMSKLCRYCGHFCKQPGIIPLEQRVSKSWRTAYAMWHARAGHGRKIVSR